MIKTICMFCILFTVLLHIQPAYSAGKWGACLGTEWHSSEWKSELPAIDERINKNWGADLEVDYHPFFMSAAYRNDHYSSSTYIRKSDLEEWTLRLGYRLFDNPGISPFVAYRYSEIGAEAEKQADGSYRVEILQESSASGAGLDLDCDLGSTGLYMFASIIYYPVTEHKDTITNKHWPIPLICRSTDNKADILLWNTGIGYFIETLHLNIQTLYRFSEESFTYRYSTFVRDYDFKRSDIVIRISYTL